MRRSEPIGEERGVGVGIDRQAAVGPGAAPVQQGIGENGLPDAPHKLSGGPHRRAGGEGCRRGVDELPCHRRHRGRPGDVDAAICPGNHAARLAGRRGVSRNEATVGREEADIRVPVPACEDAAEEFVQRALELTMADRGRRNRFFPRPDELRIRPTA